MAPPKPAIFWPTTIAAGVNDKVEFSILGTPYTATIAPGIHYALATLLIAVQAAMTAAVANAWILAFGTVPGRVAFLGTSAFVLNFQSSGAACRALGALLGFALADTASGTFVQGTLQHQNGWWADDPVVDDTGDRAVYERAQTVALSGRTKGVTHATRYRRTIALGSLAAWKVWQEEEGTTHVNEALERLLTSGWARFRWFPDQASMGGPSGTDYALDLGSAKELPRNRLAPGAPLYSLTLQFRKYV